MSRRWMAVALAMVITATLVADAGVVLARNGATEPEATRDTGPEATRDTEGSATPPVTELIPDKLEPVLPELEAFVEQARGLSFKNPPTVSLVPDDQFDKLLQADGPEDAAGSEDVQTTLGELRAFGLIEGDVDVNAVVQTQDSQILGFYDDHTKKLYVRGGDATPYAQQTLVHELTHALDDQHFGLDRPELQTSEQSDAFSAYEALIEGDAVTVENQWYNSRSADDQESIDAAESAAGGGNTGDELPPDVFAELFGFPYQVGPDFVAALRDAGGQARLDEAFVHPPTTTEQVLQPQLFLAGEGARQVVAPAADGPVIDQSSLGMLGLIVITERAVDQRSAALASVGWDGDSYRAWSDGSRTCIRANIEMDTPADAAELVDALHAWAGKHPGATVDGTDPIVITNCA